MMANDVDAYFTTERLLLISRELLSLPTFSGLDRDNLVTALRDIADRIERAE